MRRVALAAALVLVAVSASAAEISSYDVRLTVSDGGTATGTAKVSIAKAEAGVITIPLGFDARNVRLVSAPQGTALGVEPFDRQTRLRIALASAAAVVPIEISFDVARALYVPEPAAGQQRVLPEGACMLRHAFIATEPVAIRRYRCEVLFPESLRAHAIREALPPAGIKEVEPRVLLDSIDGLPGARLQTGALYQGDTASMQIELVPRSHSPLWIACGVLLSIAYLISFRSLVFRVADTPAPDEDSTDQEEF